MPTLNLMDTVKNKKGKWYRITAIEGNKVKAQRVYSTNDPHSKCCENITFTLEDYFKGKFKNLNFPKVTVRQMTEEEKRRYYNG